MLVRGFAGVANWVAVAAVASYTATAAATVAAAATDTVERRRCCVCAPLKVVLVPTPPVADRSFMAQEGAVRNSDLNAVDNH